MVFETMNRAVERYISTRDARWFAALSELSEKLERKSYQSRIFAKISRELIEKGVEAKDSDFILKGIELARSIGFRKYQADIMIDIIPLIIVWSIETRDTRLVHQCLEMINVVGDISKHSLLQSELVKALATVGSLQGDVSVIVHAIRYGATIKQKNRRLSCMMAITERLWKSGLSKTIADIDVILRQLEDLPLEQRMEIIGVIAEFLLERTRDKRQLLSYVEALSDVTPGSDLQVIIKLLEKAEKSGEKWYLDRGLELVSKRLSAVKYPVREIVSSTIAVVRRTKDTDILMKIIPLIEMSGRETGETPISQYLAIVDTLLLEGEFQPAIDLFSRIVTPFDRTSKHTIDTCVQLIREGIVRREHETLRVKILSKIDQSVVDSLVQRSALEICRTCDFTDFISFAPSLEAIVLLHKNSDSIFFECLKILISRGFMEYHEPSALLHLAEQMGDNEAKETAVSYIVIELAKIGVFLKNRDILQRAVGLTCQIEGERPRSEALSRIIDQASYLAVEQGDLDFLHRMGEWIKSLLEKDYEVYAKQSIIEGMIKYGISQGAPHALNEAYQLTSTVEDPIIQQQKRENIIEGLVKIGCNTFIQEAPADKTVPISYDLSPFIKAIELLKQNVPRSQVGLKLSRYIDIIMEHAEKSHKLDFIIPFTLFALEIGNPLERNAIFYRIATFFRGAFDREETATPHEVLLSIFHELEHSESSPVVMDLIFRLIEQTPPSFMKYSSMCNLADSYMRIDQNSRAHEILHEVHESLENLTDTSEKVIILTNLVGLLARVDEDEALSCLNQALSLLDLVQEEKRSSVLKQIIFSIVSLNILKPKEEYLNLALSLVDQIVEPVEYVNALISIFGMATNDEKRRLILNSIYKAIDKVPVSYDKATLLLDVVPLADRYGGPADPVELLNKTVITAESIKIPYIASIMRQAIVQMFYMLFTKTSDTTLLQKAKDVASSIEDEELKRKTLLNLGVTEKEIQVSPLYSELIGLRNKIKAGRFTVQDVDLLQRAVKSLQDRAVRAKYYTMLAIACKEAGQTKIINRVLQLGLEEAAIIRPLARRAYVLGDLALMLYTHKEEDKAKDILGFAVDAAINIREEEQREEVFDELSVALRIIEEHLL
ncbi:MAG: hypothetical protein QHG99_04260 [Methanomicrobiales archaeon]|nr:hypothetical protein [Methanomicrobiales archaeon]